MQFDEVLRTFSAFFEREQIRYAVIGGLAIRAWGHVRTTQDVDFVVEQTVKRQVIAFAEHQGFETIHVSDGFSNHVRGADRVDFMYVDAATADDLFRGAQTREVISGVQMNVAKPEHLSAMKAIAIKWNPRRGWRDVDDVLFLLRLPGVDRQFVRDYFVRKGLLEIFDEIEKRI
jgi:hypothetical protein